MKDIARRTGLGLATISSYFNGGNVREKNRIKIEEAIEELHYEVNEVARGLKTNATKTIGVVIPELNNTFCAEIITGMEDVLRSHGYATIVCDCRTDKKLEREAIEFLIRRRVDGVINMPVDEEGNHLKKFQRTGKPIVLIDRKIQGISCDSVLVDNKKAAEDAMQLFANLLQADGTAAMSDAETAQTLASVKDAGSISADRRNAVALCMQKGLVQGFSDGMIKPQGTFTRAEFAKLLTTI